MTEESRPRIVVITASVAIAYHLGKTRDEAQAMAQAAFDKLCANGHYPTHAEILRECGIAEREDKPWPKEEGCPGCDKHKDGPHRFDCSVTRGQNE